jgi:hypothetical protein
MAHKQILLRSDARERTFRGAIQLAESTMTELPQPAKGQAVDAGMGV